MKKLLSFFLLIIFGISFSQINVEEIKKNVTENPQKYYNEFLEIFKNDPSKLTQDEMNQLYYGSRFVDTGYSLSAYNKDYDEVWKPASKRIAKSKAQKILSKAEDAYSKNPFEREILTSLSNIYKALGETAKSDICLSQYNLIEKTIRNSGTGNSEDSPICVIRAGDVIGQIDNLRGFGMARDFKQDIKMLPDGSMLTKYEMGKKQMYVKLVGGFR